MIKSTVFESYYKLLSAYVANQEEKYLLLAEELGQKLMEKNISPEEIVEIHESAIKRLGKEYPDATLKDTGKQISMPLMEMLMSYGLAFRGRSERLEREMTERRKSEEMLKESEERFRTLAESTAMGILVYSGSEIIYVNKAGQQLTGYSEDELLGMHFWNVVHPDYKESIRKQGQARLRGEQVPNRSEFKIIRKDGAERWIDFTAGHISWRKKSAAIGTAFDITERKLAEEESRKAREVLQESEERFRSLYENSTIGLYRTTPDGKILMANPTLVQMLGYHSFEELSTRNLEKDWFEPEHSRKKFVESVESKGQISGVESAWKKQDDSLIYIRESARVICDEKGVVQYYEGTVEDITERKHAEEERKKSIEVLKNSEERLRILFDFAPNAYYLSDLKGTFVDGNKAAEELIGCKKEELIGKNYFKLKLLSAAGRLIAAKLLAKNLQGKSTGPDELILNCKDGSQVTVEIRTYPVQINNQTLILGIANDITERKQAELELIRSRDNLNNLFRFTSNAIIIQNKKREILDCNDAAERLFGYSRKELVDDSTIKLWDPEKTDERQREVYIEQALQGKPQKFEWWGKRKDGSVFPEEIILNRTFYNGAGVLFINIRDITQPKRVEEEKERSRSLLKAALESTADGILAVDRDGRWTSFNQKFIDMWGIPKSMRDARDNKASLKLALDNLVDPNGFMAKIKELYPGSEKDSFDLIKLKDGRIFERYSHPQLLNNEIVGRVWSFRDVTENKTLEEKIVSERDEFNTILEDLPVGVAVLDADDKYIYINPISMEIDGYKEDTEALIGKDVRSNHSKHIQTIIEKLLKDFKSGKMSHFSRESQRGKRSVEITYHAIRNAAGEYQGLTRLISDITERKQVQEALQESEKRYRSLFEDAPDMIHVVDAKGRIVDANLIEMKTMGYSRKEYIGKPLFEIVHPDYQNLTKTKFEKILRGESFKYETVLVTKKGTNIDVEVYVAAHMEEEKVDSTRAIIRDITARKLAEDASKQKQHLNELLLDSLPYAAMIIHKNRTILATNRAAREIGVNLGGICWRDYGNSVSIPEKDKRYIEKLKKPPASGTRCVFCKAEKALEAMETVRLDVEIENKIWDTYWIPIDRETYLHFAVDITETKNYEASLKESRDWLNKSQKIGHLGSWDQKLDDNTLKWSDETYRIFGLEQHESEMTFKGFLKFVHPEDRDFVREQTQKAQTYKDLKYQIEYRIKRTDGQERFIYERAEIVPDDNGTPIRLVGIIQDITDRKRAEEKVLRSLKEKEVLLKEIHHRVKNNLQVITSLLNLQSGSIAGKRNREAFNDSRYRIRSIALVHEVLYQSEDYSNVDFGEYLKKLTGQLHQSFRRDAASVSLDLKASSVKLSMDKAVPCGIVVNELVTNALKHAFPKGRKGKITVSLKKKKGQLELIVQDNGVGISEQLEKEKSDSLGMNLVSILVEDQLNGTLKIEQNGGTIVKIKFPI